MIILSKNQGLIPHTLNKFPKSSGSLLPLVDFYFFVCESCVKPGGKNIKSLFPGFNINNSGNLIRIIRGNAVRLNNLGKNEILNLLLHCILWTARVLVRNAKFVPHGYVHIKHVNLAIMFNGLGE